MSLTIVSARWANPAQTRVIVQSAERGTVLVRPGRDEWDAFEAWRTSGGVVAPHVPFAPSYRQRRRFDYRQLGKDPDGDENGVIGDVLDVVISELRARGASVTSEFADMVALIDQIKSAHPKPN